MNPVPSVPSPSAAEPRPARRPDRSETQDGTFDAAFLLAVGDQTRRVPPSQPAASGPGVTAPSAQPPSSATGPTVPAGGTPGATVGLGQFLALLGESAPAVAPPAEPQPALDGTGVEANVDPKKEAAPPVILPPVRVRRGQSSGSEHPGAEARAAVPARMVEPANAAPPPPPGTVVASAGVTDASGLSETAVRAAPPALPARAPADFVTLDLPGEGGIVGHVRLALRGPSLNATIVAADAATARRLEGAVGELRQALADRGFADPHIAVRTVASSSDPGPAQNEHPRQPGRERAFARPDDGRHSGARRERHDRGDQP
jgi:hypothetical protein